MTIVCGRHLSDRSFAANYLFALIKPDAEKDILDGLHGVRPAGRCHTSFLVGLCRYHSHYSCCMVDRLPQRLVLGARSQMWLISKDLPDVM
jgi:hypothetical protein